MGLYKYKFWSTITYLQQYIVVRNISSTLCKVNLQRHSIILVLSTLHISELYKSESSTYTIKGSGPCLHLLKSYRTKLSVKAISV